MQFRVNNVTIDPIVMKVTLPGGQEVDAPVQGLTVELLQVDGENTITRRFVPQDMGEALELYVEGAVLEETFTPVEE